MRPHRPLRAPSRGFTLIELMVVVLIIALLAVIAVPLFVGQIRERAVTRAAQSIVELYRGARTRALGRGAAIMVSAKPDGSLEVFEGVEGTAGNADNQTVECANLPTRGCITNRWDLVGSGATVGKARSIGRIGANSDYTTAVKLRTTAQTPLHVCFSPGGRAWLNTSASNFTPGGWTPLTEIVSIEVTPSGGGRTRNVIVLPNGIARIAL